MAEQKIEFICSSCGYSSPKWLGKCPSCGEWSTFVQFSHQENKRHKTDNAGAIRLKSISTQGQERFKTGIEELDRVLGGGIVKSALILIGGDPGIGKSTIALIASNALILSKRNCLYVTGEESLQQIKLRAKRLDITEELEVLAETDLDSIFEVIEKQNYDVAVIDSIQTIESATTPAPRGSVAQLKEITDRLMRFSKQHQISFLLIGHVTKEGAIAGPKILEHMVDTVLYFEGDRNLNFRILRGIKNRFGSTNEIGVFEMTETGLKEIKNPSELFLTARNAPREGSAVFASIEGTRALLVEIQALVSASYLAMPRRTAVGIDQTRLSMLVAVLDKRAGLNLSGQDIYINVVGGVTVDEPASDLCVISALVSSYKRKSLDPSSAFIGEVGLTGEIRPVGMIDKRIKEAEKLGFKKAFIPDGNYKGIAKSDIELIRVKDVESFIDICF